MKKKLRWEYLPFDERINKQLKQSGLTDEQLFNVKRKMQKRQQLVER